MERKKILIVDDERGIVYLLEELLSSAGYETSSAATGLKAIESIGKESFDLLILDFQLPMKNGLEIINEISEQGIETPVIMMTGMSEQVEILSEKINQIVGLLRKPFDIQELFLLVEKNLSTERVNV